MSLSRTHRERSPGYPAGLFDLLTTMILGVIFLLIVFLTMQFFLQREANTNFTLQSLNDRIAKLTQFLSLEQAEKSKVEQQLAGVKSMLRATEVQRDLYKDISDDFGLSLVTARDTITKLAAELDTKRKNLLDAQGRLAQLTDTLAKEQAEKSRAEQQLAQLKSELAESVAKLVTELDAEKKNSLNAQVKIASLEKQLSEALANVSKD